MTDALVDLIGSHADVAIRWAGCLSDFCCSAPWGALVEIGGGEPELSRSQRLAQTPTDLGHGWSQVALLRHQDHIQHAALTVCPPPVTCPRPGL